jgi:dTDP-glucose 4,6-dehydratase
VKTGSASTCHDYSTHVVSLVFEFGGNLRLLVTGGAGFIGSNFVIRTRLTRPEVQITVLDSLSYAGNMANLASVWDEIQFVRGSISDYEQVERLVSETDLVVHFAAESHNDNSLRNPNIFFETNVMGTLNIANACLKFGVRLHHISTDEVFGDLPLESPEQFSLETPYNPSSPYSASKASSDHIIRSWVRSFGLRATISNCSNNYGPNQHWEKLIPFTIKTILEGGRPQVYGNGLNVRDWIHVDDHTDGIWSIFDRGQLGQTYLLGAKDRLTNLEVVTSILKILEIPADEVEFVSDRPGHDRKYAVDPSLANETLGWRPTFSSLISNLPDLVRHYSGRLS